MKARFLKSFNPKHSAETLCTNLQDITQKYGDSVFAYFPKNIEAFKRFMSAKPDDLPQAVAAINKHKEDCIAADWSMTHYFQTQLFIDSLKY